MITPLYKPLKRNGTTLYVFPSVEEDKNFESQNENYRMYLSHYVLVNFPKQIIGTVDKPGVFDFENTPAHPYGAFNQNATSIPPAFLKDAMVESLRNYVANHEAVIRNSKINASTYYYDTFEPYTTTEKIFWKWCKSVNAIDFEVADPVQDFFGADTKYNNNGPTGNINHYKEYLFKERSNTIYDVLSVQLSIPGGPTVPVVLPSLTVGTQVCTIQLSASTTLEPNDYILLNIGLIDSVTPGLGYSTTQSLLKVIGLSTTSTLNDTIVVEIDIAATLVGFGTVTDRELYSSYNRFVQFICEVGGLNNVQLPDKAYTETFAYISHQHGQIPYSLWNIKNDNNYKPNSQYPILASEIQAEIQGGENPNNPILINPTLYPGDIWGQFDTPAYLYETQTGDIIRRWGNYYGNNSISNITPSLKYPDYDGSLIDGLVLNLNINDYAEAVSYVYPIESFNEFCATSFNNIAPKDFEFNAILWYYTIEDVSGNTLRTATNLYGVEFLDTPENDLLYAKTKIPVVKKLVSNGYQDGNAYTFSLDINIAIDSDTEPPSFDPEKVYSLFGMELFYEALTRITYFNDQLTNFMNSNMLLNQRMDDLSGLVYNQQSIESIRNRMNNLELLLNVYSTLQIGESDTIVPRLDTSVNPPLLRLDSVDKQYGYVYQYDTKSMYTEFTNVNSLTDISIVEKTVNVVNGKDFLVIVNNNDNSFPVVPYDNTKTLSNLSVVINKDLNYKQKIDILILPKTNIEPISITNPVNEPINDKKLNLFINYNDGINTIKQQLGEFSLPVLKYYNGVTAYNELVNGLHTIPYWKIRNVFYSKANTNDRVFSFIIEDDLVSKLPSLSRVYIDNFFLEQNPALLSNSYKDFSSQYMVYNSANNPSYIRSEIIAVEIVNPGTGYTNGTVSVNHSITMPTYFTDLNLTTSGGIITNVEILNSEGLTLQSLVGTTIVVPGVNNDALIKFIVKPVTKINIAMNINANATINTFLNAYDLATNINALPINTMVNADKYMKMNPLLTLLKGYKISIVRTSNVDLPVSLLDQRYNVKIDML
jgi:hypothetical protein